MDRFQEARKEELANKCGEMGMDLFEVKDFIEQKGIWENSMDCVLQSFNM